jgi:hypothetical protein
MLGVPAALYRGGVPLLTAVPIGDRAGQTRPLDDVYV